MNHRNIRQSGIIDQTQIETTKVGIIGAGAIGRQLAVMLGVMGVGHIEIIDNDIVDTENLGCQGHLEKQVGMNKAVAVAETIAEINSCIKVVPYKERYYGPEMNLTGMAAVFSCVDQMDVRKYLFDNWRCSNVPLFVDGRMSAMTCRSIAANRGKPETLRYYQKTLFEQKDGVIAPCTAKSTFFNANIAAGLMVGMFVNELFLKMSYSEKDVLLNIPAFMLSVDADNELDDNPQSPDSQHLLRGSQFSTVLTAESTRITPSESLPSAGSPADLRCPTTL